MFRLIMLFVFAFIGLASFAQQHLYNLDSLLKQYPKPNHLKQRAIINQLNIEQKIKELGLQKRDTARFEYANNYGLVYKLPADNMPCLKPFINDPSFNTNPALNLNNYPTNPAGQIPNPLKGNQLVLERPGNITKTK